MYSIDDQDSVVVTFADPSETKWAIVEELILGQMRARAISQSEDLIQ
jgi:hypothetical protein